MYILMCSTFLSKNTKISQVEREKGKWTTEKKEKDKKKMLWTPQTLIGFYSLLICLFHLVYQSASPLALLNTKSRPLIFITPLFNVNRHLFFVREILKTKSNVEIKSNFFRFFLLCRIDKRRHCLSRITQLVHHH